MPAIYSGNPLMDLINHFTHKAQAAAPVNASSNIQQYVNQGLGVSPSPQPAANMSTAPQQLPQPQRNRELVFGSDAAKMPDDLKAAIFAASQKTGLPANYLSALAGQESTYRNISEQNNPKGLGRGYFQIDLGQHPDVTEAQAMDPNFAAEYAANLLKSKIAKHGGDFNQGVMAYNGTPGTAKTLKYLKGYQSYLTGTQE